VNIAANARLFSRLPTNDSGATVATAGTGLGGFTAPTRAFFETRPGLTNPSAAIVDAWRESAAVLPTGSSGSIIDPAIAVLPPPNPAEFAYSQAQVHDRGTDDVLVGGAGSDIVIGGYGKDILVTGFGHDRQADVISDSSSLARSPSEAVADAAFQGLGSEWVESSHGPENVDILAIDLVGTPQ
jgi:hypothetical protein